MALALFYCSSIGPEGQEQLLDEDTTRHVVQALRMQPGDKLQLTDGKGLLATCVIVRAEKKKCAVVPELIEYQELPHPLLHMGIAFTRNSSRNEWLLEKAAELGARSIIPLVVARSEREKSRPERWHNILVSAMLQSQQRYLPVLHSPVSLAVLLEEYDHVPQKLIAHCMEAPPRTGIARAMQQGTDTLFLIGPEGDFTAEETVLALERGCKGISLGSRRLRTETAAMTVCAYFNLLNHE